MVQPLTLAGVQGVLYLSKIYAHIYPRWDIAFDRIFGYTDAVEIRSISAPRMTCGHIQWPRESRE